MRIACPLIPLTLEKHIIPLVILEKFRREPRRFGLYLVSRVALPHRVAPDGLVGVGSVHVSDFKRQQGDC